MLFIIVINKKTKNTTTRCKGKLAVFQNELKPLSKSSGLLFAVINDKPKDGKLSIRCVLCEQSFFIELENSDLGSFYRHLDQQHFGIASQIRSYFSKVEDLFLGVDTNLLLSSETNNLKSQRVMTDFFGRKQKQTKDSIRDQKDQCSDNDTEVSKEEVSVISVDHGISKDNRVVTVPLTMETRHYFKYVVLMNILGIPLSSCKKLANNYRGAFLKSEFGLKIPSYDTLRKYMTLLYHCIKKGLKSAFPSFKEYALCCDGWSVLKPNVSLEAYFLCFFHHNEYKSYLLDCAILEQSTGTSIAKACEEICSFYGLDSRRMVTTDGARNNLKAFQDDRALCNAHAIDGVMKSFIEGKSGKDVLCKEDLISTKVFLDFISRICSFLRGGEGRCFQEWVKEHSDVNVDCSEAAALPEVVSPTRWIGLSVQLRWMLKYAVLFYRYLISKEMHRQHVWEGYDLFLVQVQELSFLVFSLERGLNLLSYSTKPTLHLVLPVRIALNRIASEYKCVTDIGTALKKVILYELSKGKLVLEGEYKQLCMSAVALFPEADRIVDSSTYEECLEVTYERFRKFTTDAGISLESGYYNDIKHVLKSVKEVDERQLDNDWLYSYIKSADDECVIQGCPELTKALSGTVLYKSKRLLRDQLCSYFERLSRSLPTNREIEMVVEDNIKAGIYKEKEKKETTDKKKQAKKQWAKKREERRNRNDHLKKARIIKEHAKISKGYAKGNMNDEKVIITPDPFKKHYKKIDEAIHIMDVIDFCDDCIDEAIENARKVYKNVCRDRDRVPDALFCFKKTYQMATKSKSDEKCYDEATIIQRFLEYVMSIAASESVCERFFRIPSQIVKRSYVTNMKKTTVREYSFITYYQEIAVALCKGGNIINAIHDYYCLFNKPYIRNMYRRMVEPHQ